MRVLSGIHAKSIEPDDLPAFDLESANFFAVSRSGDDQHDFVTGEALANQALFDGELRE